MYHWGEQKMGLNLGSVLTATTGLWFNPTPMVGDTTLYYLFCVCCGFVGGLLIRYVVSVIVKRYREAGAKKAEACE